MMKIEDEEPTYVDARLGKLFESTEEYEILRRRGITQQQLLELSDIPHARARETMALIAAGMEFKDAWIHVRPRRG